MRLPRPDPTAAAAHTREGVISRYIGVLMAIVIAILHLSIAPLLVLNGVRPNLALVAVVLATALLGLQQGMVLAFVAGTTVSLVGYEPLGTAPFALLIVVLLVAGAAPVFERAAWAFPVVAALFASGVYDATVLVVFWLLGTGVEVADPLALIIPASVLNAVLAGVLLVPARILALRYAADEGRDW